MVSLPTKKTIARAVTLELGLVPEGIIITPNTCGNQAKHEGDNGDKHIAAMGYISGAVTRKAMNSL